MTTSFPASDSLPAKPRVIALEEHYCDPVLAQHFTGEETIRGPMLARMIDVDEARIREMDEAGIDHVVLSHNAPATQKLPADKAVSLARLANDNLRAIIERHPARYSGFAILPTADPGAAAAELERAVTQLHLKGTMIHGLTNGVFLDDQKFWPIFERAEALDVPIYLHPSVPHPAVIEAYYRDYVADFPRLLRAGWGFTVETATQAIRLVLSGALERFPRLKFILGHFGESLPFLLWRIDNALSSGAKRKVDFRKSFSEHFWVTTSGHFSNPALLCTMMELGVDRIMFSVDWPFSSNKEGVDWLNAAPVCAEDRAKIFSGNAARLLRL